MASQRYEVTNSMLTSGVPVVLSVLGIRPLEDYERLILKEAKNFIQHAKTGQNVLIAIERGQRIIPDPYAVSAIDRALSVLNAESILKQIGKKFGTSAEMQEVLDNIESVIDQALEDDGMNRNETPEGKLTLASNFFNELTENLLEDQEFPLK